MLLDTYWKDLVESQTRRSYEDVGEFVEDELIGEKFSFHNGELHYIPQWRKVVVFRMQCNAVCHCGMTIFLL